MPHASIGESLDVLQLQNQKIMAVPEVELAVGKIGRVQSPLDPAPMSMIETVINYKSEYIVDSNGHRQKFRYIADETDWSQDRRGNLLPAVDGLPYKVQGRFDRDEEGQLIQDPEGIPFRQWRRPLASAINP